MKTPDEIKKGLECCMDYQNCTEGEDLQCPYYDAQRCMEALLADALALIQQLEAERDAAVRDIKQMVLDPYEPCFCEYCKRTETECAMSNCKGRSAFEWRGVQKEG